MVCIKKKPAVPENGTKREVRENRGGYRGKPKRTHPWNRYLQVIEEKAAMAKKKGEES